MTLDAELHSAGKAWADRGANTEKVFTEWVADGRVPTRGERGGGDGGTTSEDRLKERRDDRRASHYRSELNALKKRLEADCRRLRELIAIAHPPQPKEAPEQGCRSHARIGVYEPCWEGRLRNACRFCGEWRAAHGDWPPLPVMRWRDRNPGKRLPLHVVEQAS